MADKFYLETVEHKLRMNEAPSNQDWLHALETVLLMNAEIEELRIRLAHLKRGG